MGRGRLLLEGRRRDPGKEAGGRGGGWKGGSVYLCKLGLV